MIEPVHDIMRELSALQKKISEKMWVQYTTGLDFGVEEAFVEKNRFVGNKAKFKVICDVRSKDLSEFDRRGVDICYRIFQKHHLSENANRLRAEITKLKTKLTDVLNKNRTEFRGVEISHLEWSRIVSESPDRDTRREAFLAQRGLNQRLFDAGFLKLIDLRKEFALACGAKDFVSLRLEQDDLTPDFFEGWKDECRDRKTAFLKKEGEIAAKFLDTAEIRPWDLGFLKNAVCPYNKAAVDMGDFLKPLSKMFAVYGFDISKLNLTFDVFPRKNKSEWGYNFTLESGRDSRVLANVDKRFSGYWVLLHETAHGVHFLGLDPDEQNLNLGVSDIVAEGFANFFGDLAYSKEFLNEVFAGEIKPIQSAFRDYKKLESLSTLGAIATMIFDQELYSTELRTLDDVHELKWSIDLELTGKDPYADEPMWASRVHHTSHPIYLHNYILGDVMCENMKEVFERRTGRAASVDPLGFGTFWKEKVLAPSGRYPFLELYEKVCEEPLRISGYLDHCLRDGTASQNKT